MIVKIKELLFTVNLETIMCIYCYDFLRPEKSEKFVIVIRGKSAYRTLICNITTKSHYLQ